MSMLYSEEPGALRLIVSQPSVRDGADVYDLVRSTGSLDLNSGYAYLLLLDRFSSTCRIARLGGQLAGVVIAFRAPERPDTVFVWQIAVRSDLRGSGLGGVLLERLFASEGCRGASFLEAHVTPNNLASEALFRSFARQRGSEVEVKDHLRAEDFPTAHSPERLLRVGPLG
jgi:L-2,4-diaminobutyric acid acetyltransferase